VCVCTVAIGGREIGGKRGGSEVWGESWGGGKRVIKRGVVEGGGVRRWENGGMRR